MDLRQLRHFLALANHLNFTRAAESACITQSAFSRSIQGLESELGCALVERTSRGIVLTAKGTALRERAARLLDDANTLRDDIRVHEPNRDSGWLRFGAGPLVMTRLVPDALAAFVTRFPQAEVDLKVDKPSHLLALLDDGDISFLVADLRHMEVGTQHLVRPLRFRRFGVFCRSGHPLLAGGNLSFQQLAAYPRVSAKLPFELRAVLERLWGRDAPALNLETPYNDLLPKMVAGSDTLAVAPLEMIEPLTQSGLFQRIICHDQPPLFQDGGACLGIVQLSEQPLSETARCMIDALLDADDTLPDELAGAPGYHIMSQVAL
ncbi:LysR family transcriptional regulator [Pseudomonas sp. RIT-To-2]|uniref:LysR family transcriptional regulator n=1 Tax=Pseudomonas sp. RIT-To-2 TaxID=3462541 RepID=UPI0024136D37